MLQPQMNADERRSIQTMAGWIDARASAPAVVSRRIEEDSTLIFKNICGYLRSSVVSVLSEGG